MLYVKYIINPTAVHIISLDHVAHGRDAICIMQRAAPNNGRTGESGALNGRLRSGRVLRRTTTDIHTTANAIRVPIDTSSLKTWRGNKPAIRPVAIQASIVAF